jgi:hypothetical protein
VLGSVWSSVSENCFETDGYVDDETMANEQLSNVMVAIQRELASGGRVYWHGAIAPDDLFWKPISKYDLFFQLCKIRAVFFFKMKQATSLIPLEGLNCVKSLWKR